MSSRSPSFALLPPLPDPDKIVCIGLNYRSHAAEAGIDPPEQPTFFAKFRNALVPSGATVKLPAASEKVDYEAEVAFVVGRRCKEVDPAEALDADRGLHAAQRPLRPGPPVRDTAVDARQGLRRLGPVRPGAGHPRRGRRHRTRSRSALDLNGERMQEASTSDLVFSVTELVARLSRWMTLEPGDIVSTGTPSGVGSVREPRVWLKPGDEIVISSPTLGELRTTIA